MTGIQIHGFQKRCFEGSYCLKTIGSKRTHPVLTGAGLRRGSRGPARPDHEPLVWNYGHIGNYEELWLLNKSFGRSLFERELYEQQVNIPTFGEDVGFEKGEGIRTEIGAKFTPESATRIFSEADMELLDLYTDDRNLFSLALAAPRGQGGG